MGKRKRYTEHMKSVPHETLTAAQVIMRDDMAAGRHQPITAGQTMDEMFGRPTSDVTDIAVDIIANGPKLELSFSQWVIVQGLIEDGVIRGRASRGNN